MSIDQSETIDFIGIDRETGKVVLTVSDHLDWGDVESHVALLESKVNNYIAFIESGQLAIDYPDGAGREVSLLLAGAYSVPTDDAYVRGFLDHLRDTLAGIGVDLSIRLVPEA